MSARPTILFFTDGGFLSHTSRALAVACRLRAHYGCDVVAALSGPYSYLFAEAGFKIEPIYTLDREITLKLVRSNGYAPYRLIREINDTYVQDDLRVLKKIKPDLIVSDYHWYLSISARYAKIPYVSIINAGWSRFFAHPYEPLEQLILTRVLGRRVMHHLQPALIRIIMKYWILPMNAVGKKYGVPRMGSLHEHMEGDMTLFADTPSFAPTRNRPASFHYTGPILWQPELPEPVWLKQLNSARPTLYFTMGSTGYTEFFEDAVSTFGGKGYQVIITTGGLEFDQPVVPPHVYIEELAPGHSIMQRSDVVISHGGNGTIYQALASGVPVIGIPCMAEQEINMQLVRRLGVGATLPRSRYSPVRLRSLIHEVLRDEALPARLAAVRNEISAYSGADLAAADIFQYYRTGDPALTGFDPVGVTGSHVLE